jgi:hypothetical protein
MLTFIHILYNLAASHFSYSWKLDTTLCRTPVYSCYICGEIKAEINSLIGAKYKQRTPPASCQ